MRFPIAAAIALFIGAGALLPARSGPRALPPASTTFYETRFEKQPGVAQLTAVGRRLFFDASLSASGRTACASCHDPAHAYGPPNARAVQLAGPDGKTPGLRAAPSLRYVQKVPPFTEHFFEADGNDSEDQGPAGGHAWDGRARSLHEQAVLPLLSPLEMANRDSAEVVARVRRSPAAAALQEAFGPHVLDDPEKGFRAILLCLEVFQQDPAEFYPYSSKYDAFLRGQVKLAKDEMRGLALFNDAAKGNCASCHISAVREGEFPAFSDWGFIALGVPRNRAVADPKSQDLGLCGPMRTDLSGHAEYCGRFRTPTLRNVSKRAVFFHNGKFTSLEEVVRFYAERDTNPARWYPRRADGSIDSYDDIPPAMRGNVNREPPFGGKPGSRPRLDRSEIRDVVAFLRTLEDGYTAKD
ncbi:MAG TPA: cytochrome c peroxidase [Usitatibacter sp.]|nr:cytochrome c peroxidase [Usitatibacter sp.]